MCERLYALSYALRACMAILWIARAVYTESLKPELGVHRLVCVSLGGALRRGQNIQAVLHAQLRALRIRATALGFGPSGADQRRIDPGPSGGTAPRRAPRVARPSPLGTRAPRRARAAPRARHPAGASMDPHGGRVRWHLALPRGRHHHGWAGRDEPCTAVVTIAPGRV